MWLRKILVGEKEEHRENKGYVENFTSHGLFFEIEKAT